MFDLPSVVFDHCSCLLVLGLFDRWSASPCEARRCRPNDCTLPFQWPRRWCCVKNPFQSTRKTFALCRSLMLPNATTVTLKNFQVSQQQHILTPTFCSLPYLHCFKVLLVTCNDIDQKEFQGWDYLFQLAGLAYAVSSDVCCSR